VDIDAIKEELRRLNDLFNEKTSTRFVIVNGRYMDLDNLVDEDWIELKDFAKVLENKSAVL